jgi:hypothetical protein
MNSIPQYTPPTYKQLTVNPADSITQARLPPSPQFQTRQHKSQDTNYVGITISEDDPPPPPHLSPSITQRLPLHESRHTEHNYGPESNISRTASSYKGLIPAKRQPVKRISDSSIYQSNISMPSLGLPTLVPTYEKTSLARHSSATLPSINAGLAHLPPAPKLSHSATVSGYDRQTNNEGKQQHNTQSPNAITSPFLPSPPTQSTSSNSLNSPSSSLSPYTQRDNGNLKRFSGSAYSDTDRPHSLGSMLSPAPFGLLHDELGKRKDNSAFRIVTKGSNRSRTSLNPPMRKSDIKPPSARLKVQLLCVYPWL